jgi:4-hydroxybenzoate polyprenyltransferase|tara:strand:- start:1238 stop:2101 length:864 start_codon:yes stop_codon:yes gene_type:complete
MNQLNLFVELTRFKKPIGYMLLFWPCAWGLTAAFDFSGEKKTYVIYLFFFLAGSILMRSAGCIVNDIFDKKFDIKVSRTKNRPIASGKISIYKGIFYSITLCLIAFLVLVQFNYLTIILALGSMPLAFTYPLMKRFTYWPQLFLGITFNYGLVLGWTSIENSVNIIPIIFYIGAIFWTLGFDTIYGFQDLKDDEIIGLKSTSIKFKSKPHLFLKLCYTIFLIGLFIVGFMMQFNKFYYLGLVIIGFHLYFMQIYKLKINDSDNCLKIFKSNNLLGAIVLISLMIGKI